MSRYQHISLRNSLTKQKNKENMRCDTIKKIYSAKHIKNPDPHNSQIQNVSCTNA